MLKKEKRCEKKAIQLHLVVQYMIRKVVNVAQYEENLRRLNM